MQDAFFLFIGPLLNKKYVQPLQPPVHPNDSGRSQRNVKHIQRSYSDHLNHAYLETAQFLMKMDL
jgi:hypothetical protein